MPSTHLSLQYHLVFSTKERYPLILKEWRADLHAYLGGIVKGLNGVPLAIGGVADHAHLLVGLRATLDWIMYYAISKPTHLAGFIGLSVRRNLNGR